jgi:hypothetical protein
VIGVDQDPYDRSIAMRVRLGRRRHARSSRPTPAESVTLASGGTGRIGMGPREKSNRHGHDDGSSFLAYRYAASASLSPDARVAKAAAALKIDLVEIIQIIHLAANRRVAYFIGRVTNFRGEIGWDSDLHVRISPPAAMRPADDSVSRRFLR